MRRVSIAVIALLLVTGPAAAEVVDFTFAVWSDPHFREEGPYPEGGGAYRDDSAEDIATLQGTPYPPQIGGTVGQIELVLVTGDITDHTDFFNYQDSDGETNDDFISHINRWFTMPVYEITGNHDSYNEPGASQIRAAIAARHGDTSYSFDYLGVHFIGLDGWTGADGRQFHDSALAYLEAHMPTLNTEQAIIIFNHYDPEPPGHVQWDRLYDAIEGYNVILLCNGHTHYPRVDTWRGFDVLVTSDCKFAHENPGFSIVHITDSELTAVAYDWYRDTWRTDVILQKPITGLDPWFSPEVVNPSFEAGGGSLDGWQIFRTDGKGPDNPPHDNSNPYDVTTPFGDHFAGKITNWGVMDFTLGQIIEVAHHDPASARVWWSLSAWVQMHCRVGTTGYPANLHQVWEIGWNNDGSAPASANRCDQYQVVANIDATYTANDGESFFPLSASGAINGVTGLRYVAFRARLYIDEAKEWSLNNLDNISFEATAVPPEPWIGIEPPAFQHTIWIRDNLPNDSFTVTNVGVDTLTYVITDDASDPDWLCAQPDEGVSTGEADVIQVIYDVAGLNAGQHAAAITVTSPDASNSPRILPVTIIVETVQADFDGDADVDQADFGHFQACLSGAGAAQTDPACGDADFDGDKDVDPADFARFLGCMSGPGQPAGRTCADD